MKGTEANEEIIRSDSEMISKLIDLYANHNKIMTMCQSNSLLYQNLKKVIKIYQIFIRECNEQVSKLVKIHNHTGALKEMRNDLQVSLKASMKVKCNEKGVESYTTFISAYDL